MLFILARKRIKNYIIEGKERLKECFEYFDTIRNDLYKDATKIIMGAYRNYKVTFQNIEKLRVMNGRINNLINNNIILVAKGF